MGARDHPEPARPRDARFRVLVAFEDARTVYAEAIARTLGELRPDLEARPAALSEIGRELRIFDPHAVVCSETGDGYPGGRAAWVQVPTDDGTDDAGRKARLCLGGRVGTRKAPRSTRYSTSSTRRACACARGT